jgi:hypothetical protein
MDFLSNSKFTAGIAMFMLNIGARYIQADFGKGMDLILNNEYVKKSIVFSLFFIATRDIPISIILLIFYIIVVDNLLHDKRKFCIIPKKYINESISNSEYEKAKLIVNTFENKKSVVEKDYYSNYINNLSHL